MDFDILKNEVSLNWYNNMNAYYFFVELWKN